MGKKGMTQPERIKRYADLIQKQTGRAIRPYRADGYVNMMTKYGTTKDPTEHYRYIPEPPVPDEVLTAHYETNGLFAKIIDTPAEEAIKHGFTIADICDQEVEDFYTEALDELNWEETCMTAIKWARLFGGSIIVMLINDGRGLEEPVDWKNVQSIDDLRVYDRSLIQPDYVSMYSYDPTDPFRTRGSRLGMPEYYQVFSKYGDFVVHDSRCLVFQNGILPENTTNSVYEMWGVPEYVRLNKSLQDAELAHRSAPKLLDRSVQPVYKMKDLAIELATEEGEDRVLRRLQVIDMARGLLNSLVIDAEGEDYDFKTFQFSGVNDVISASCNMLSAISNIPQTILFGQTVGGLSTTDDTSMENYYNYIERIQKRMVRGNLRYLLSVIFQAGLATGEVDEMPKINVRFNPLWSMSDVEEADMDLKKVQIQQVKAQTAQMYVDMQVLDPSEIRKKLADSDEFDIETMLDEYDEEELGENPLAGDPSDGMPGAEGEMPVTEAEAPEEVVSTEELNDDPNEGGGETTAAPAATKIPQDMSEEETEALKGKSEERENGDSIDPYRDYLGYSEWLEENLEATIEQQRRAKKYFERRKKDKKKNWPNEDGYDEYKSYDEWFNKHLTATPKEQYAARKYFGGKGLRKDDISPYDCGEQHCDSDSGAVGVVVVKGGKVLCGKRHNTSSYGMICGPGGNIEAGETPEQAAVRETKEEFGITPKELIPLGRLTGDQSPWIYLCTEYEGEIDCSDLEMTTPKFCTLEELEGKGDSLYQPFIDGVHLMTNTCCENFLECAFNKQIDSDTIRLRKPKRNTDGGPGSGNHNHEGNPGHVGGSAPKGSASSARTAEKISAVKESLSQKNSKFKCNYLKRAGVISNNEARELLHDLKGNGFDTDEERRVVAEAKIEEYVKQYFESTGKSYEGKSIECEGRDTVAAMTDEEATQWVENSIDRDFTEEEYAWANTSNNLQKVVIDMGLTGTPQVVCQEDFDSYIEEHESDGYPVIYRGLHDDYDNDITSAQMFNQMLYNNDEPYMGNGAYGDGLYFSTSESESADVYAYGKRENVIKCTLNVDSKVLECGSSELRDAMSRVSLWGDYSVGAVCAGYDAIKVTGGNNNNSDFYVVLNRSALIVVDPMEKLNDRIFR